MGLLTVKKKEKPMSYSEISDLLAQISTPLSLYLVPLNLKEEREKFFESSDYNPQFRYRTPNNKNAAIFSSLQGITEVTGVDPEIGKFVLSVIESKNQASDLLYSIGKGEDFIRISNDRFGIPSYQLFVRACKILRRSYGDIKLVARNEKLKDRILKYDDVVKVFSKVFEIVGLSDWSIEKSKAIVAGGFRTAAKTRRILVDPGVEISAEKLRKTLVHEVLTHALRASNGFATGFEAFGKPNVPEYLDVEEGLAMYNEEKYGVLRDIDVRRRAALVYAIYLSQSMSFRQVFNAIRSLYPKNNAFDVIYRVKRGLGDTSQPGCYTKDAAYLRGFLNVRKELTKDALTYKYLYAGKLSLKHLSLVEEGVLPKPKVVPTKELVEKAFHETGLVS